MKRLYFAYTVLLSIVLQLCNATHSTAQQHKQICVLGSSTSWGYFGNPPQYPADSSWPNKIKKYYKNLGIIDTLFNLSVIGTDPYQAMPTSYISPPDRGYPDPLHNITRAVNLVPRPDVIIVNFPTNHYDYFSQEEVINCLSVIRDSALAKGIMCYIATTQPRNNFSLAERMKLRQLRDQIIQTFGIFSIDFYTDIAEEQTLLIDPLYSLGDNVHINAAGHSVLYNKVLEKNIFQSIIAVNLSSVTAVMDNDHVLVNWDAVNQEGIEKYIIERSNDGISFNNIREIPAGINSHYIYHDYQADLSRVYYRIVAVSNSGWKSYSAIMTVNAGNLSFYIYPTITSSQLNITLSSNESQNVVLKITNMEGKVLMNKCAVFKRNDSKSISVASLFPGNYVLTVSMEGRSASWQFIRL